jgi:hypothetical protein
MFLSLFFLAFGFVSNFVIVFSDLYDWDGRLPSSSLRGFPEFACRAGGFLSFQDSV